MCSHNGRRLDGGEPHPSTLRWDGNAHPWNLLLEVGVVFTTLPCYLACEIVSMNVGGAPLHEHIHALIFFKFYYQRIWKLNVSNSNSNKINAYCVRLFENK